MTDGDSLTVAALEMPEGVTHEMDPEEVLVSIVAAEEVPEPEVAETEEGEAAEGEAEAEEEAAEEE